MWKAYRHGGKFKAKFLAVRQFISPPQGALIVCCKRVRGFRAGKKLYIKYFAVNIPLGPLGLHN